MFLGMIVSWKRAVRGRRTMLIRAILWLYLVFWGLYLLNAATIPWLPA